jgi:membrane protease YdiL (CAAX protease family)
MASTALSEAVSQVAASGRGLGLLAGYGAIYTGSLLAMRRGGFAASEALMIAALLGMGFSLVAWIATVRVNPLPYIVLQPPAETAVLFAYLFPLTAFVTWGFDWVRRTVPADPAQAIALGVVKLAVFVGIPAWLMRWRFGYTWNQLAPGSLAWKHFRVLVLMSVLVLWLQAVVGRGFHDIQAAKVPDSSLLWGVPLALVWLAMEAGVVEEFFFRCLLQSRVSAALKSELGGIVVMALLFGLMHAPGLYLRTGATQENLAAHPSLSMAVGYSVVVTSVAGFFLGVLWARTRNFFVVVAVHAATDLLPDLLPTLRSFHLLR